MATKPTSEPTTEQQGPTLYEKLAAPFDETHRDVRGGVELTYITGEQVATRLNEVLGPDGWSFSVKEHGLWAEADEMWALGRLVAKIDGTWVIREQFGSQKIKRSRASGTPLDIGFDFKGATTDAMKKCATLIGVGLYLSHKESLKSRGDDEAQRNGNGVGGARGTTGGVGNQAGAAGGRPAGQAGVSGPAGNGTGHDGRADGAAGVAGYDERGNVLTCEQCGSELKETQFRDGTVWTPAQLAGYGRRKHNRVLCMTHYREANDARKRAEAAEQETPF